MTVCHALLLGFVVVAANDYDTLVVCPREFQAALRPWREYREGQGHRIHVIESPATSDRLRAVIRKSPKSLRSILLIGDAEPQAASARAGTVPTRHLPAKINIHWGSEPELATDNWYADLDDDRVPDVAIGRLPVDSPAELERLVARILMYEARSPSGSWSRRINFVAGVGGFGALADSVLESTTRKFLTEGIPSAYATTMTYGSWQSPFCPDPRRFHEATVERFNEGCVFWVYIGHGQRLGLDRVHTPGGTFHILDANDTAKLQSENGCPIALFLACHIGSFDQNRDCLAEEMLRSEGGPIAILSGSRVTMPYAMAVFGDGLMNEFFSKKRETLGEVFLHAKRWLAQTVEPASRSAANKNRILLDALAKVLSPAPDLLDEERLEHVQLFNLLGDPLLRLPHPESLTMTGPDSVRAGELLQISCDSPLTGDCTVELVCRRDTWKSNLKTRPKFDPRPEALSQFMDTYYQANDLLWTAQRTHCDGGPFEIELDVPEHVQGHCHVRVVVDGVKKYALGATNVFVHARKTE